MAGDYAALKARLLEPDLAGLSDEEAASALAASVSVPVPGRYLLQAGVLSVLGLEAGVTVIEGLKAASQVNPALGYVVETLQGVGAHEGVDFGDPAVQGMLGQLAAAGVLSTDSAATLIAYGSRAVTVAETLAGWEIPISVAAVQYAREKV